ncbi:MAG: transporter substrate-binding domain-containing protein [Desulfobacteraceae bacterium]
MHKGRDPCLPISICFWTLAALTALAVFFVPGAQADKPEVRVGVYENAPKVFVSESGTPSGFFIDIIEHIAEQENWELKYIPCTWGEGLQYLKQGRIDLMPDVAYTGSREKIFSFHKEPVLSDWFQVYARKNSNIKSIVDLAGKRISVLEQSVQEEMFKQLTKDFGFQIDIVALPDYQTIFSRVADKQIDAAITNRFYGTFHAQEFNLEDTAIIFSPTRLFFAAPLTGRKTLLTAIDVHMKALKADNQSLYYQALRKWTSGAPCFTLPAWVKLAGSAAAVLLLISLAGSAVLKHQVTLRTRELLQINQEMEKRIEDRTAELAAAMEKARAADQLKSAFLATMSHELRTPLNSIIGFTGILIQGLAGDLNQEQKKQLGMVQQSSRHLLALINDVLDISKIEAGQMDFSLTRFNLKASIEKTAGLIAPAAEKKNLDLTMDIAEDVKEIVSDQRRLEQIILNLLNNALKFTEQGEIRIVSRTDNSDYVLDIIDTGIGIEAEEIKGLFQPFHQIDSGLTRKREGTGLGLSISKKLMDLMNGTITIQSQLGKGSTFTLRFPKDQGGLS